MSNKVQRYRHKKPNILLFRWYYQYKNFDLNSIKIDQKSYKDILIYYIRYVTIKNSKYVKINSASPLYLTFGKVNWYIEEINGNKYLKLVPINESKEIVK